MKTITKITTLTCLLLLQVVTFAQVSTGTASKVALHHNGTATFHTDLQAAYTAAETGDTIYVPAGSFNGIEINKKLTIIGVGYYPDSVEATGQTYLKSMTSIYESAAGGCLMGLNMCELVLRSNEGTMTGQYLIKRCRIENLFNAYPRRYSWIAEECIINGAYLSPWYTIITSFSISKCIIFYNKSSGFNSNGTYSNSIIYIDDTIPNFYQSTLSNNIFICSDSNLNMYRSNLSVFEKNLFCSTMGPLTISDLGNNTYINNYTGKATSEVFINANQFIDGFTTWNGYTVSSSSNYVYTQNYHLLSSISNTILGNDNTQVGIYGTPTPFKDGSLPFNPHISSKFISTSVNPSGNLKVNIKVTSQDR